MRGLKGTQRPRSWSGTNAGDSALRWILPAMSALSFAFLFYSSQMVVWLPRSALPRAVTRYGLLSGYGEEN